MAVYMDKLTVIRADNEADETIKGKTSKSKDGVVKFKEKYAPDWIAEGDTLYGTKLDGREVSEVVVDGEIVDLELSGSGVRYQAEVE